MGYGSLRPMRLLMIDPISWPWISMCTPHIALDNLEMCDMSYKKQKVASSPLSEQLWVSAGGIYPICNNSLTEMIKMNRQRVLIGDHHNAQLSKDVDTKTVLCVDLDGTLLSTDILWESILLLLKKRPWKIINFPFWLLRGKAYLKRQVAQRVELCAASLPIR